MTITKQVIFEPLDHTSQITISNPSDPYTVTNYVQGKTIVTPTGNKVTQILYEGYKLSLKWDGLSETEYNSLTLFLTNYGYDGFNFIAPDSTTYKCVVDGTTLYTSTLRYARLSGITRYAVSLKLITIP